LRSVSSVPHLHPGQESITTNDIDELAVAEHYPASNDPRRRTYDTYSKPVMEDIKAASIIPSILLDHSPFDATEDLESSGLRNRLSSSLSTASMDTTSTAPQAQSPISSIPPFSPSKQRPLSLMNTLLMRKLYRQHHHHSLDPTLKYWNALHFISMVWLTMCALYTEWQHNGNLDCLARLLHDQYAPITDFVSKAFPSQLTTLTPFVSWQPLFTNFVTLELLLFGAFILYHPQVENHAMKNEPTTNLFLSLFILVGSISCARR
jgi:hypothetical protein